MRRSRYFISVTVGHIAAALVPTAQLAARIGPFGPHDPKVTTKTQCGENSANRKPKPVIFIRWSSYFTKRRIGADGAEVSASECETSRYRLIRNFHAFLGESKNRPQSAGVSCDPLCPPAQQPGTPAPLPASEVGHD